jgi:SHS2 domain-containing protein
MTRYEYLDHTGDVGLRVYGRTLSELFTNAAYGLLETIADVDAIHSKQQIEIEVSANSIEDLLVAWLDELVFRHEVEEILFGRVEIQQISEQSPSLSAIAFGEPSNLAKHAVYTEIKSVTYHQLFVRQETDGNWVAQMVFDL